MVGGRQDSPARHLESEARRVRARRKGGRLWDRSRVRSVLLPPARLKLGQTVHEAGDALACAAWHLWGAGVGW